MQREARIPINTMPSVGQNTSEISPENPQSFIQSETKRPYTRKNMHSRGDGKVSAEFTSFSGADFFVSAPNPRRKDFFFDRSRSHRMNEGAKKPLIYPTLLVE